MALASISDALNELATRFAGQLLQPLDIGYDEARRVHNGVCEPGLQRSRNSPAGRRAAETAKSTARAQGPW